MWVEANYDSYFLVDFLACCKHRLHGSTNQEKDWILRVQDSNSILGKQLSHAFGSQKNANHYLGTLLSCGSSYCHRVQVCLHICCLRLYQHDAACRAWNLVECFETVDLVQRFDFDEKISKTGKLESRGDCPTHPWEGYGEGPEPAVAGASCWSKVEKRGCCWLSFFVRSSCPTQRRCPEGFGRCELNKGGFGVQREFSGGGDWNHTRDPAEDEGTGRQFVLNSNHRFWRF